MNTNENKTNQLFIRVLSVLFPCVLFVFICSCDKSERIGSILPNVSCLKEGDVVFRLGVGFMSRTVLEFDNNGLYSHVGIVVDSAGYKMVVHAVPNEHDSDDDVDRVRMDTPEKFFGIDRASVGEVRRCVDSVAAVRASVYALKLYKRGILFDHSYDINDSTRMYCTELVNFAYSKAGLPLFTGKQHFLGIQIADIDSCVFPSDLYASDKLVLINKF